MDTKLESQLRFIREIDKMKTVLRRTLILDGSRRENDAEHSWHLAMYAMVLGEYADPGIDLDRVIKMTLVHDLVEVYAGDTFAFDAAGNEGKEEREALAADRLFGMLPDAQGAEMRGLWEEFEAMETRESQFAAAMDRLQPFIHNSATQGHTWRLADVTKEQVYKRIGPVKQACPALWEYVESVIADAVKAGYIKE